ncbi:2-alkenal reductase (NADP(+)-dependent)-like [Vitis riparia]|uniref:2-alkenal reductase (NADP(+)-dependent)-like n=1 Tax=Vitis riparia TaxID=96939 RepID=UPI00155B3D5F|nr:2-alkenal reductase (NADP(+)-dependent)-like [Vitis riparia]XP_034686316.1 2-alkenal reductase (NADP(+)-dependent)-like [Vitis riparia]
MRGITAYAGFYRFVPLKRESMSLFQQHLVQLVSLQSWWVATLLEVLGSKEKVDLLKNKLGFNEAFNYKEEHELDAGLKRCFPEGIDIYFDNVGGKMLDAVLLIMRTRGCIAACGMVSQYNLEQPESIKNLFSIISKQVCIQGFVSHEQYHLYPQMLDTLLPYIREGKLVYVEDIAEGLERSPAALVGLFSGRNVGKQVAAVAHE